MKTTGEIIYEYRRQKHLSQIMLAHQLQECGYDITNKNVSKWEKGLCEPSINTFMELCRILEVPDIYEAFYGTNPVNPALSLNEEGQQKVREYASLLAESGRYDKPSAKIIPFDRNIRLYYEPVSAGPGNILTDNEDSYEWISIGNEVPSNADFAVRIRGNSMEPRFIDGQIVFVHRQETLESGEIGIFLLDGDAYIKKLQNDRDGQFLISLNRSYAPIPITAGSSFTVFGKVVG